ncbi:MAG TPA: histidinol-phosphate transaminase [Chthonomonadales bacterium]|nr:histidinol-phosphate transaminase [Chthonomonadales bacterium]
MELVKPAPPHVDERIRRLVPYSPGKPVEEVKRELGLTDVIKLASNENALGPSPMAIRAIRAAAERVHAYPEGSCHELRAAVARRHNVPEDWLTFGNGSDDVIHNLGLAFLLPGDEVIEASPTFSQYATAAALNNAACVSVPTTEWVHDLAAMADRITDRTRVVFIANPNNPTGTMVAQAEVDAFMRRIPERALVVFDEAYHEYVERDDYPDALAYVRAGQNVVVLRTFSKIFGLAGLRVGYGVARPEIVDYINRVREPFNVNLLAQAAALAALDDAEHLLRSRELNRAGLTALSTRLRQMGLPFAPSEANFVWVDVGRPCRSVFQALLSRGVIVRTGDVFGAPTHLRVTTGTAEGTARFLAALEEVLEI